MPRPTRSKLRGKQPASATTKKEAETKKPVVENVISTRKRSAAAPLTPVTPAKTRKKGKNAKSPVKKQPASASNQTSPKKKKNEPVEEKVEGLGETSRSTRSRLSTRTLKKVPVAPTPTPPIKNIRTRSMLRKRTESPKKNMTTAASTVLRTNNSNKVAKKKETETESPPRNKKSAPKKSKTSTKPQSKVKTKAKKVVVKKTPPPKAKAKATAKTNTRKSTSQKATEPVEKIEVQVQQRRGRRSTQRSEVAKTPLEKKSVRPAITRPRRRMHKSAEDDKKEEETQMEKTESESESVEETKPKDETDVSTTTESKIDDPQEQTKADHRKEQTEMEGVETDEAAGKGKRKLDGEEKEENGIKKAKVDETDKEASLKEDGEMDLDKEGKANDEKEAETGETEKAANEKSSPPVVEEAKEKDEVKMDVDEKVEEKKEEEAKEEKVEEKTKPMEIEAVEKKEETEKEEKKSDEAEKAKEETEKDAVEPTTNQNNCQTVTETPPEKLLAAEDATTEDETPVENSTPTTNGVIYETKETPVMIGRRKFVKNARLEDKKDGDATKHKFSVATYNLQDVAEDKAKQDIEELEADIVCFQQVGSDYYTNKLQPNLKSLGYVGFHHEGTNEQKGLAMFCKTATFEFVDKKECDLSQLVKKDIEEKNLDEKSKESLQSFLNKSSSSALYIKLKSVSSQKTMSVCNTSLTPSDQGMHTLQLAVFVRELISQSEGQSANPHLLCGTLNLEEGQPGFQVLKDGYLDDKSITSLQDCKNVPSPGKTEDSALVDLLWKCFQHSSSGLTSSYNVLSKDNASLKNKNSVWHSSDSLRVMGVLDLEVEGNKETSDDAIPLYVQFDFN